MPMTAKQAIDTANAAKPGERLHRYERMCAQRGNWGCQPEPLEYDRMVMEPSIPRKTTSEH
jgi:hypothetical protein